MGSVRAVLRAIPLLIERASRCRKPCSQPVRSRFLISDRTIQAVISERSVRLLKLTLVAIIFSSSESIRHEEIHGEATAFGRIFTPGGFRRRPSRNNKCSHQHCNDYYCWRIALQRPLVQTFGLTQ
eukprot:scaffold122504_cov31-Prasinocladus_malaysianus.AAC.1